MNSSDGLDQTQNIPSMIGRYRVKYILGHGGFGCVYLATDEELDREVAIKVPNANLLRNQHTIKAYLSEARMVAKLDHPNIVPVYDVGTSDEFGCYIVSKYIEGADLRKVLKDHRFNHVESASLVAKIADALHHAHRQGLVHRDIKPSNILLDPNSNPYVADFGLALPEQDVGKGPKFAGTPAYMSPEQARGEGHRVDGRSDVFSLGAILFELLSGKRAFRGDTRSELREQIELLDPRPLRQYDEKLPKELDRICQKALAKRAKERYWTAHDMSEDLNAFLATDKSQSQISDRSHPSALSAISSAKLETRLDDSEPTPQSVPAETGQLSVSQHAVILPKGLRSFDKDDADFFLELLPGPRDRDGLPDILRFWKKRVEATDEDDSFRVGLIYGPSGCGKSSFVNAGLIPRLSAQIIPIFIEATTEFTESRLLAAIHKICPQLNRELDLRESIATIRRGEGTPTGTKVVLIVDQFEQWLHGVRGDSTRQLVDALRQCDGVRIQAMLMVRSDFWMAVTQFLNELEIDLVQGKNFAAIDLFPPRHARKVLIAFGRAFGTLPSEGQLEPEQTEFVNQSIEGLAQGGKLICVRLALYAEMMKNKPWTSTTLKQIGGTEGVGSSFLEDSFGPTANPKIRLHQVGARSVLRSLLPDLDTMINVKMQTHEELFQASGYTDAREFDSLIRILDGEMRLISPTDPSGILEESSEAESKGLAIDPDKKYFRLTHDYLVNSLRIWLNRKQRETRKGRAELLLAERASFWRAKHEIRYLPSILEHFRIRSFTSSNNWTKVEKEVMGSAAKTHGRWLAMAVVVVALFTVSGFALRNYVVAKKDAAEAALLVEGLLKSDTRRASEFVADLSGYRMWADKDLQAAFKNSKTGSQEKLHAAMALAADTPECLEYIREQLPVVSAAQFLPVFEALEKANSTLPKRYPELLLNPQTPPYQRLLAACAIAQFDENHEVWSQTEQCKFVSEQLTRLYPSQLAPLRDALRPIADSLIPTLGEIFLDQERGYQQRMFATESLVDYEMDSPQALFRLLVDCDERQFPLVFEALVGQKELVMELAQQELKTKPAADASEREIEQIAVRQANSAVALYRLNQFDDVWPILQESVDPRLRSYFIHWIANREADPAALLNQFQTSNDLSMQRELILGIGEFDRATLDATALAALDTKLELLLRSKKAALKSAAQWLRAQNDQPLVQSVVDEQIATSNRARQAWTTRQAELVAKLDPIGNPEEWTTQSSAIATLQAAELADSDNDWYYSSNRQLMIRVTAESFLMGDPNEKMNGPCNQHLRHIDRIYSLASTEVSGSQWAEFLKDPTVGTETRKKFAINNQPNPASPIINVTWFEAVHYCNWLSQQEGIPESQWCYVPRPSGYVPGMRIRPEFWKLHGYRLPTQSEWEFACRAGSLTQRHYGSSDALLGEYAWYQGNSHNTTWPVGTRKPNQWGFFDLHGNATEWCFDLHFDMRPFQAEEDDAPLHNTAVNNLGRSLRGGAYYDLPSNVRTPHRHSHNPESQLDSTGFRIARTLRDNRGDNHVGNE